MKMNKTSNLVQLGLFILVLLGIGCHPLEESNQQMLHHREPFVVQELPQGPQMAMRGPRQDSCMRRIDFKAVYESWLKKYGVNNFSTQNLINLLDSENERHRYYSVLLLGERNEISAIPKMEEALGDESFYVWWAAAASLLKMDNRKGVPTLLEFCEKTSAEFDEGNYKNTVHLSDVARVLAEAGEVSAIPYLRKLLTWDVADSSGVRITALRSIGKLYAKEPSVVTDISSMLNDEHPQIRAEAAEILQSLEASQ